MHTGECEGSTRFPGLLSPGWVCGPGPGRAAAASLLLPHCSSLTALPSLLFPHCFSFPAGDPKQDLAYERQYEQQTYQVIPEVIKNFIQYFHKTVSDLIDQKVYELQASRVSSDVIDQKVYEIQDIYENRYNTVGPVGGSHCFKCDAVKGDCCLCCSKFGLSLKQVGFGYWGKKNPRDFQPIRLV